MSAFTKLNLKTDVEDMAPGRMPPGIEAHFAKQALGTERSGISYFKLGAGYRPPFGHRHAVQEEVYVVLSGSARIRVEGDEIDLAPLDAIRVAPDSMRAIAGGPDGCELLAFGAPRPEGQDAEIVSGWWE